MILIFFMFLENIKMYSRAPVIPPARKRTEFDYNYLSPEDRRRLERPMASLDDNPMIIILKFVILVKSNF